MHCHRNSRGLAQSGAVLIANAAARSLITGTDFGDNIIAALPDTISQTIGNFVAVDWTAIAAGRTARAQARAAGSAGGGGGISDNSRNWLPRKFGGNGISMSDRMGGVLHATATNQSVLIPGNGPSLRAQIYENITPADVASMRAEYTELAKTNLVAAKNLNDRLDNYLAVPLNIDNIDFSAVLGKVGPTGYETLIGPSLINASTSGNTTFYDYRSTEYKGRSYSRDTYPGPVLANPPDPRVMEGRAQMRAIIDNPGFFAGVMALRGGSSSQIQAAGQFGSILESLFVGVGGLGRASGVRGANYIRPPSQSYVYQRGSVNYAVESVPIKFVPNPYGKLGGPEHVAAADVIRDNISMRGLLVGSEYKVLTPKGDKGWRFIDVVGIERKTGLPIEFYQVGKQTKAGFPVARETRAINDIKIADPTINPIFIPYNK